MRTNFISLRKDLLHAGLASISLMLSLSVYAQSSPSHSASSTKSVRTSDGGAKIHTNSLKAVSTVKDNISVEAGLLTPDSAKELFGGWVSDHFAVVQVTIGNQSRDQQFILQDIFFDYTNWALSGIYANPGAEKSNSAGLQDYQKGTSPAQISSIGALEIHDAFKSNSVFSPRNRVVNGLVLVGTAAGAYAFLGPSGFKDAVTGFTSEVIPGIQKYWPDRTIDQQSNLLKYGYQDKLVIAKEDPGKTYAFFPIERFLTSGLAKLYKKEPAIFLNLAELYIDPKAEKKPELKELKDLIDALVSPAFASEGIGTKTGKNLDFNGKVLSTLFSPCYNGKYNAKTNPTGEESCLIEPSLENEYVLENIRFVKDVISKASLNTVRIVVSGIMTVDIQTIPATITKVTFDKESDGAALWSNTTGKLTAVIEGKYLLNGKPKISGLTLTPEAIKATADAKVGEAKLEDYIDTNSIVVDQDNSTDSELYFSVQLKKKIPSGTKLSFQVVKLSSKSVNSEDGGANTSETTTSMTYPYTVSYTSTDPVISDISFTDKTAAAWAKSGAKLSGTIVGKNLNNGKIKVSKIVLADKTAADPKTYGVDGDINAATDSTDVSLKFTITPTTAIPPGAVMTFTVTTGAAGSETTSDGKDFTTPSAAEGPAAVKMAPKKPAGAPKPPAGAKPTPAVRK